MIGTCRPFTIRSKPRRNGSSVPVRVICPSGKMQTISPSSSACPALRSARRIMRVSPAEVIGMTFMAVINHLNSGCLA